MIGEELVFFSLLYIKLFELVVEVALDHRSAVTHHKVNLLRKIAQETSLVNFTRIEVFGYEQGQGATMPLLSIPLCVTT